MDWLCPSYTSALHKQLDKYYGNITAENTVRDIVSIVQTGNLHTVIYDIDAEVRAVDSGRECDSHASPAPRPGSICTCHLQRRAARLHPARGPSTRGLECEAAPPGRT